MVKLRSGKLTKLPKPSRLALPCSTITKASALQADKQPSASQADKQPSASQADKQPCASQADKQPCAPLSSFKIIHPCFSKVCLLPKLPSPSQYDRSLWTPPPLETFENEVLQLAPEQIDTLCGALQRYTRTAKTTGVRPWKKFITCAPYNSIPCNVMRKWLRHVLISGMSWSDAITQIPRSQKNAARKIMLDLHANLYKYGEL